MLKVLLTIDTETHPVSRDWKQDHLASDMKRDLFGEIDDHAVGLEYQLETLARNELRSSFMVESLFAGVPEVGEQPLKDIVRAIASGGHDIELHPHPEWLAHVAEPGISYRSHLLSAYSAAEQEAILRFAIERLERAGAPTPVAFRAAGFAANSDTLVALKRCGLQYDSSFNGTYRKWRMPLPKSAGYVTDYNGVLELPVAVFEDYRGHFRPAQICACSTAEMIHALTSAEAAGWEYFVIVSHSFEMLTRRRHPRKPAVIRWDVVERFERLCQFLAENRERFPTVRFADLDPSAGHRSNGFHPHIKGKLGNTISRVLQQARGRIQTY